MDISSILHYDNVVLFESVIEPTTGPGSSSLTLPNVHVRELNRYLLDELKVPLPPKMFTEPYKTVRYPYSIIKSGLYWQFGLELENAVMQTLSKIYKDKLRNFSGSVYPSILSERDKEKWSTNISDLSNIGTYFQTNFPLAKVHSLVCEAELSYDIISGHPDLIVYLSPKDVVIFDVKVFALMKRIKARDIRAQIAIYAALARKNGLICNRVGIIMPWARDPPVVMYDITKWNSDRLLDMAIVAANKIRKEPECRVKWRVLLGQYNVGSHVHKNDVICLAQTKEHTVFPFQLFLYGNNPSAEMERKARKEFDALHDGTFSSYNAFIHAPYNLNLALTDGYVVTAAKMYLRDSARLGFKGVVFHVGHHTESSKGIAIMKRNITEILKVVDPETPFILETPCGNSNELLSTPEEFGRFVTSFPERLCGICLDTCHVFVSGYMPTKYIESLGPASYRICLVHFNGSRKAFGCGADGHAPVTTVQNIPDEELIHVLERTKEWEICAVTE